MVVSPEKAALISDHLRNALSLGISQESYFFPSRYLTTLALGVRSVIACHRNGQGVRPSGDLANPDGLDDSVQRFVVQRFPRESIFVVSSL